VPNLGAVARDDVCNHQLNERLAFRQFHLRVEIFYDVVQTVA
jgi:hypothetical protein